MLIIESSNPTFQVVWSWNRILTNLNLFIRIIIGITIDIDIGCSDSLLMKHSK